MTSDCTRRRTGVGSRWVGVVALCALAAGLGAGPNAASAQVEGAAEAAAGSPEVARMVAAEELLLTLSPLLSRLSNSLLNLQLPDHHSRSLFASQVTVRDLTGAQAAKPVSQGAVAASHDWALAEPARTQRDALELWRPLLDQVAYFEYAELHFVKGRYHPDGKRGFGAQLDFGGLAYTRDGRWISISAGVETLWRKPAGLTRLAGGVPPWQLVEWSLVNMTTVERSRRLFREVVPEVLPDPALRARAEGSLHEAYLIDMVEKGDAFQKPHPYFLVRPTDWQPGLSVVDIDRDGLDDLYVMDRWGANLLLRNRGDGSFEDIAPALGLDLRDHSSSAVFADFDNDGDIDVFVGRTLERSRYLVNEDGHFVDRSEEWVGVPLPALVTSVSAADFNGDGLLDVYFSTYAAELMAVQLQEGRGPGDVPFLEQYLSREQAKKLAVMYRDSHKYLGRAGPPNVLLQNLGGGRFGLAHESEKLAVWRNTFQATWSDYDSDGDADLYVANDFSPNHLFRNDGGTFHDVTEASRTADIGFGMGASWGDYDNDGRQDLYVSNMYSKAGSRITAEVPGLDERLAAMARGNSMFRNLGGRFEKVSGLAPPALQVERAGWSWGGQFVDVDNDGFLDVYASSGMYTAPKKFAIPGADL